MSENNENQDWEEIDPKEAEIIVATLEGLMERLDTETLVAHLQEVVEKIEALVDWEDEDRNAA